MITPFRRIAISCAISICSFGAVHAANISWGAAVTNGVGDASGTPLAAGDLVELGSFGSLTPSQIASSSFATLKSDFVSYGSDTIGDGTALVGTWYDGADINSTNTLGIVGNAMYYWVFNGTSVGTSTQQGIFTGAFSGSNTSQWFFPDDNAIPNTAANDISDGGSSAVVIGGYGGSYLGAPLYELATIPAAPTPEPSAVNLALLGGLGLVGMRFFLKRQQAKSA